MFKGGGRWCSIVVAFTGLSLAATAGRADVVYSNLGPAGTFDANNSGAIRGSGTVPFGQSTLANQFTAPFSGNMTTAEVVVFRFSGTAELTLRLYSNNPSTNVPMTQLATLGSITAPADATLVTLNINMPVLLAAGETYWLGIAPGGTDTLAGCNYAIDREANLGARSSDDVNFEQEENANAFRITAAPIPEPSTWAMLGTGTLLLAAGRRFHARPR